jgi:pimeloyl-ACP methyl ester carboxylesterase
MSAPGPTSHIYVSQRLRLHYVDWGNPEAPPLILVHGGRDHCRNWDWVAAALRRDWHIIAPDLRGHGDSAWSWDGNYTTSALVYDLAQLIHQRKLAPVSLIGHSLGGFASFHYAALYPENVRRLVLIEGLGLSPKLLGERAKKPMAERLRTWIGEQRAAAARVPRRYATIEDALTRMLEQNKHLTPQQARHLTEHGVSQNEDGTYSWKFDNYIRIQMPVDLTQDEVQTLWGAITCPTLLVYGKDSWASNPAVDGRARHFREARVALFESAGHWVHHDRTEAFLEELAGFL